MSEIMADHYLPPLRRWFLEEARFEGQNVLQMRGSDLIRLGYPGC